MGGGKSKLKKHAQNTSRSYGGGAGGPQKVGAYDTSTSATKKTSGVDKGGLQGTKKENRGRKSSDAPRGKRKQHTKYEHTKKSTKKGRK